MGARNPLAGCNKSKERCWFQPALMSGIRRAAVAPGLRGTEPLVHDLADGAGAAAALGAAAEAAIDLPGGARPRLRRDGGADIVVAQNVAGADDHGWVPGGLIDTSASGGGQSKSTVFICCLKSKTLGIPGLLRRTRLFHGRAVKPPRRTAPRRCPRPHPRPGTCCRPPPSPGSPARCRRDGLPAGP